MQAPSKTLAIEWKFLCTRNNLAISMDVSIPSAVSDLFACAHTYIVVRFAIRGETLFRTAPIEETVSSVASGIRMFTKSKTQMLMTLLGIVMAWVLIQPWNVGLIPDVANAAAMAKQFEPLIYASENVIPRSRELADASIAVQDLGESVRATNMSASTVIIDQLDSLGDNLKVLSEKLTSFFTNVDGDMDS